MILGRSGTLWCSPTTASQDQESIFQLNFYSFVPLCPPGTLVHLIIKVGEIGVQSFCVES